MLFSFSLPNQKILVPRTSRGHPLPKSLESPEDLVWSFRVRSNLMSQGHPESTSQGRLLTEIYPEVHRVTFRRGNSVQYCLVILFGMFSKQNWFKFTINYLFQSMLGMFTINYSRILCNLVQIKYKLNIHLSLISYIFDMFIFIHKYKYICVKICLGIMYEYYMYIDILTHIFILITFFLLLFLMILLLVFHRLVKICIKYIFLCFTHFYYTTPYNGNLLQKPILIEPSFWKRNV